MLFYYTYFVRFAGKHRPLVLPFIITLTRILIVVALVLTVFVFIAAVSTY